GLETVAFGIQRNVYAEGHEWVQHSILPVKVDEEAMRGTIGGAHCTQPYSSSLMNLSALRYEALSTVAINAVNIGAREGRFSHNTGEGGISSYHQNGGDLIWQVGTGYFGCRHPDGSFNPDAFQDRARLPQVKMIELKLSQGAKPGKGGVLPGPKVN